MKTPRDLNGSELVKRMKRYGYSISHQTGSHIILKTPEKGEHTLAIPNYKPLRVGTLDSIFWAIAEHFEVSKQEVMERLSSKK